MGRITARPQPARSREGMAASQRCSIGGEGLWPFFPLPGRQAEASSGWVSGRIRHDQARCPPVFSLSGESRRAGRAAPGLPMAPFRRQADAKGACHVAATQGQRVEQGNGNNEKGGQRDRVTTTGSTFTLAMADRTGECSRHLNATIVRRAGRERLSGQEICGSREGQIGGRRVYVPGQDTAQDHHDQEQKSEEPVSPAAHHVVCRLHQSAPWPNRKRHSHSVAVNTMP
jgi:hypothetical protein